MLHSLRFKLLFFFALLLIVGFEGNATTNVSLPAGSYIINMGRTPQTTNNGIKPYGLVYHLLKNYNVPIYWVINPGKSKDGVDFSHNARTYRGGPFVISAEYLTGTVKTAINSWNSTNASNGIDVDTTVSTTTIPVYATLSMQPYCTMDAQNGSIAAGYLTAAGIPATAYNWKLPSTLTCCDDIFVMPHADPEWSTHGRLFTWNQDYAYGGCRGAIWAGCHAVSVLENVFNPGNTSQRLNFLMKNGSLPGNAAVDFGDHDDASFPPAYLHYNPADPVMQFIGLTDGAQQGGSEQVYLPTVGWRNSTKLSVVDGDHPDVPSTSPGPAAKIAYGSAKDSANFGKVCYEGGHSFGGTAPANIAAMRAFLNFLFWSMLDKSIVPNVNGIVSGTEMSYGENYVMSASPTGGSGTYTYQWSVATAGLAGTFSPNATSASVTYNPGNNTSPQPAIVTVKVTDGCGRVGFQSWGITLKPGPQNPVAINDTVTISNSCATTLKTGVFTPLLNDTLKNGGPAAITLKQETAVNGTFILNPDKTVSFTAPNDFSGGQARIMYKICDLGTPTPKCDSAYLIVNVGTPDAKGCYPGFVYGIASEGIADTIVVSQTNSGSITNLANSLDEDSATFATFSAISTKITFSFPEVVPAGDTLVLRYSVASQPLTISIEKSIDSVNFSQLATHTFTSNTSGARLLYIVGSGGAEYLRITKTTSSGTFGVGLVFYDVQTCLPNNPSTTAFGITVAEDDPTVIDVFPNISDPQGKALKITNIVTQPTKGKVSINPNNTITYVSNKDTSGTDNFTYEVCNSAGYCSNGTVNVTIQPDGCGSNNFRPIPLSAPITATIFSSMDANILKDDASNNNGGDAEVELGKKSTKARRIILTFDTTGVLIPSGALIQSATLNVYNRGNGDNVTLKVSAHQLYKTIVENQVTWDVRSTGNNWGTGGGEFNRTPLSTTDVTKLAKYFTWDVTNLVGGWFNGTKTREGFLLRQVNDTIASGTGLPLDKKHIFYMKERTGTTQDPKLVITYQVPGICQGISNRQPLSNPDSATLAAADSVNINVKANDIDVDWNTLTTVQIVVAAAKGTATVNGDNTIKYKALNTYNGVDSFRYRVFDGTSWDTSIVTVVCTNAKPIAVNDAATTNSGTLVSIAVKTNDTDPETGGAGLAAPIIITSPSSGTAVVSGNNINYSPDAGFTGTDTFYYAVYETVSGACSPAPLGDTAMVVVTIVNQAPDAVNDAKTTNQCAATIIQVLSNDTDPESGTLSISIKSNPSNGTITISDGTITYNPNTSFTGIDNFQYYLCDNGIPAKCDSATVTITVNAGAGSNNAPVANFDSDTTVRAQVVYLEVKTNDSDADADSLGITIGGGLLMPAHGTISIYNGKIIYTPSPEYTGLDSFVYRITDYRNTNGCYVFGNLNDTAKVLVSVRELPNYYVFDIDDDNDGIPDVVEACGTGATDFSCVGGNPSEDADGDGIPNYKDPQFCTLNAAGVCNTLDKDGDGIINQYDLDSDNDGIPDLVEAGGTDTNGDGVVDDLADLDGDGLADRYDPTCNSSPANCASFVTTSLNLGILDSDGDGILNQYDLDADNDGVPDVVEAGGVDANGDGRIDNYADTDGDGFADKVDGDVGNNGSIDNPNGPLVKTGTDANNDGSPDSYTQGVSNVDGRGLPNFLDIDADDDGIPDIIEAGGTDANNDGRVDGFTDTDSDGWSQNVDGDQNNDGTIDNLAGVLITTGADANSDGRPDTYPSKNNDGTGLPNFLDLDADDDGVPDLIEVGGVDTNGDGRIDTVTDTDGDGLLNAYDPTTGGFNIRALDVNGASAGGAMWDRDGDGIANYLDLDADNDGIFDIIEVGGVDADGNGRIDGGYVDADNDGFIDTIDPVNNGTGGALGTANITTGADSNSDGIPNTYSGTDDFDLDNLANFLDIDADNDGIIDNVEGQTTAGFVAPTGVDTDGDGIDDAYDLNNGGTPFTLSNKDGTDTPDYIDYDSDNDKASDFWEGYDNNGNGYASDDLKARAVAFVTAGGNASYYPNATDINANGFPDWMDTTAAGVPAWAIPGSPYYHDSDGDGLVDIFDPSSFGAFAVPPNTDASGDKDWRDVGTITPLPVVMVYYNCKLNDQGHVVLKWGTSSEINNEKFEVQRSHDGVIYEVLETIIGNGTTHTAHEYSYTDRSPKLGMNYYRLRQVDFNGDFEMSNLCPVKLTEKFEDGISLYPNPLSTGSVTIQINTHSVYENVELILMNNLGQVVSRQTVIAAEGKNYYQVDVSDLAKGIYLLHINHPMLDATPYKVFKY